MKRNSKILAVVLTVFLLSACAKGSAIEIGDTPPDFTLSDINGKAVTLSGFKGKIILLDFFASWCPPCRQEIPDFIELQKAHEAQGFTMLGVSLVAQKESSQFAEKMGINYPVVVDDEKVSNAYGPIRSIPTTLLIGKDFKITRIYIGYRAKNVFEKDIQELLK